MTMKLQNLPVTTNSGGAASATGRTIIGKLYAIEYRPGTLDTGATVTVTCESGSSKPLLTKTSAGTANTWFYPRDLVHAVADGAALTGTAGGDRALPILNGAPKVVIASGGSTLTGAVIVYYEE
jgi:hypothetical protein